MAEQQRLNSLDPFRKHPGRLVLEEYAHCEIPAGCGGVVLRSRNPLAARPLILTLYTPVEAACWIDGTSQQMGQVDLAPGTHALALRLDNVNLSAGLLLFAAVHEPKESGRLPPSEVAEPPVKVVSAADGTWKYALESALSPTWTAAAFADGDWPALVEAATPQPSRQEHGAYRVRRCTDQGAVCLGLPVPENVQEGIAWWQQTLRHRQAPLAFPVAGSIWIRKAFTLLVPEERTSGA